MNSVHQHHSNPHLPVLIPRSGHSHLLARGRGIPEGFHCHTFEKYVTENHPMYHDKRN